MQHCDDSQYMSSSIYVHLCSVSFFIQTQFHSVCARTRNKGTQKERERESSLYYCFVYVSICVIEYWTEVLFSFFSQFFFFLSVPSYCSVLPFDTNGSCTTATTIPPFSSRSVLFIHSFIWIWKFTLHYSLSMTTQHQDKYEENFLFVFNHKNDTKKVHIMIILKKNK